MKKIFYAFALASVMLLASCDKTPKSVNATVTIDETSLAKDVPVPDSYVVTLTNTTTSEVFKADSENGSASFVLVPGIYNVMVEGQSNGSGATYSISGSGKFSALEEGATLAVTVNAAKATALIFKELYYTGVPEWYFRDQYYEIYNNSDQTVYADGLCICNLDMYDYNGEPIDYDIPEQEKYVFAQFVWQIPGDGDDYPIAPGESFVIAQWATDHTIESLGGSLAKDLTGAEFEAIVGESTLWNGTVITDNPAVNMRKFAAAYDMPQWLVTTSGAPMVIFFPSEDMNTEMVYTVGSDSEYGRALAIPTDLILDAFRGCETAEEAALYAIPTEHEAGYIICSGAYSNESVVRKIAETKEDGRIVYKDTNNSSNDFEISTEPKIRRNGEGVPSWNTWN